jgi:hypothetical protein
MTKGFPGKLKRYRKKSDEIRISELMLDTKTEPLTDDLIDNLVQDGWDKDQLLFHRKNGGMYSKNRNTVLYPAEFS